MIRSLTPATLPVIPAFEALETESLRAMWNIGRLMTLKSGEVLLYQGDLIYSFYVVLSGGIRLVHYMEDGQVVCLKVYGSGDVFGLLAISGSYPHPTQVEVIQDCELIAIDGQDTRELLLHHPQMALTIIDLLTAHVHEGHDRVRHMAAKRVDKRLARSILKLCDKFGKITNGSTLINISLTQRDLAEFTGTTVETINRTLTQWEKQGWLSCAHKRIVIQDRAAIEAIAEST